MYYTYTTDLPTQVPVENARLYVKLPRSILLPPYLAINPYFVEFTDAIDQIFDAPIDAKIQALANLRNVWATSKTTEATIASGKMISIEEWGGPDRSTVINQVNMLGMRLTNADLLDDNSYRTISRFLGQYWFEKGKGAMIDFLNFCTNTQFALINLWTQDYKTFLPEGDSGIGTTIYDGGTWYPTTHVRLQVIGSASASDLQTIGTFFYEIANYNLVLDAIVQGYEMDIVSSTYTIPIAPRANAQVVGLGLISNCHYTIHSQLPA